VRQAFLRLADARATDDRAAAIFDAVATDIAQSIVTLVNLLDVDHVVFGGPFFTPISEFLLERVPPLVRASPMLVMPHEIVFAESAIGDDVAAIGAGCLVLDHLLSPRPAALLIQR
jgi:predicted NBD/HSP70 family sugar kinase